MTESRLHLEDLQPGWQETSGPYEVTAPEMIAFASKWDPRPFHVDQEAARASHFGGLVACGTYILAVRSALVHLRERELALVAGLGSAQMRLPNPVRPGDSLFLESTVVEARPSRSQPDRGIVAMRDVVRNQDGRPALEMLSRLMVLRREKGAGES